MASKINNRLLAIVPQTSTPLPYGTAGFRAKGHLLKHVVFRSGLLVALCSLARNKQTCGVCITASHNPSSDNGIKLVDASGGMLAPEFEVYATELVNCPTEKALEKFIEICSKVLSKTVPVDEALQKLCTGCTVILGRDTRETSPELAALLIDPVELLGATVIDLGEVTTPQLHFAVLCANNSSFNGKTAEEFINEYYRFFGGNFRSFCQRAVDLSSGGINQEIILYCDGANGVGALRMGKFAEDLATMNIALKLINTDVRNFAKLNNGAGAEHCQKSRTAPTGVTDDMKNARCCALDGDADRLVYFVPRGGSEISLIDGDRIGALYFRVITKLLENAKINPSSDTDTAGEVQQKLRLGVVQTAYANGGSTKFFKAQGDALKGLPVTCDVVITKTGVKHLHHAALQFDVAVYFESNGHGTVLFDSAKLDAFIANNSVCAAHPEALKSLKSFLEIFNAATGDAMAGVLAAEAALKFLGMSTQDWMNMYADLYVAQQKVAMPRKLLDTLKAHPEHEMWLLEPQDLQNQINMLIAEGDRAFVRPSGTEDACRIYAESAIAGNEVTMARRIEEVLKSYVAANN